jgi:hypothetical protein
MKGKTLKQITNTPKAGLRKLSSLPSNENFNIELISDESGKKYTIDVTELSNSTSGIESIVAGDNITIDDTDPLNPIVSASGGGTSALFPNGIEIVNASRDFRASDAGKMLFLLQDVNITFDNVFVDLSTLGVFCIGNNTVEMENGSVVSAANGEFLHLIYGGDGLAPISSFKYDGKTALRYLYDKSQYVGFRGTATLSSGTVTVATDKILTGYKIYVSVNTPSGTQGFLSAPTGSIVDGTEFVINSTSVLDNSTVNWWIAP